MRKFGAEVEYSCGAHGTFVWPNGTMRGDGDAVRSRCLWNQTWSQVDMPECKCEFIRVLME